MSFSAGSFAATSTPVSEAAVGCQVPPLIIAHYVTKTPFLSRRRHASLKRVAPPMITFICYYEFFPLRRGVQGDLIFPVDWRPGAIYAHIQICAARAWRGRSPASFARSSRHFRSTIYTPEYGRRRCGFVVPARIDYFGIFR
jgi:hypothetical protein